SSSRRRHTRFSRDWSSDVCSSDLVEHKVDMIKLTDYPLPVFGEDTERENGYPLQVQMLRNAIAAYDALIIAVNEHNGGPSAFFKIGRASCRESEEMAVARGARWLM